MLTNEAILEFQNIARARAEHEECEDDERFLYQACMVLAEIALRLEPRP